MSRAADTSQAALAPAGAAHCLTFDVEEYFQVEAAAGCVRRADWDDLPRRAGPAVDRLLDLLASRRTTATFFVLGWVAARDPDLVRRIAAAGHEVASHGMAHQMLDRLSADEFRRDLCDSRALLADLAGRPVRGYRAPTFSVTHRTAWAIDVLAEEGFAYDSSVFPIRHDRYGVPEAPTHMHLAIGPSGGKVLEIPPLTWRLAGANWPVGGGGYLRLLPVAILEAALARAARTGRSAMIYLHPWELDPDQPVLPMGRLACWRHRVGLRGTEAKLRRLLDRFRFTSVAAYLDAHPDPPHDTFAYGRA